MTMQANDLLPTAADLRERTHNSSVFAQRIFIDKTSEYMKKAAELGSNHFSTGFESSLSQRWINEEFIPALEKNGFYVIPHDGGKVLEIRWDK